MINWHGAYLTRDGEIIDSFEFPEDRRVEILDSLMSGDLSPLREFLEKHEGEEVRLSADLKNRAKMRSLALELARRRMKEKLGEDYILIQTLASYDDVISIINLMQERILELEKIEKIRGENLDFADLMREELNRLRTLRDELAKSIEKLSRKLAPNLSELVGPIIASRLIHYAGGLERLAKLPASTIQVLGAEDAFFQHLKKGTPCPKHGIIFQVAEIRKSPKRIRGKIARALAGKIAIAARIDYHRGEFAGDRLKEEFKRRVEEIRNDSAGKGKRGRSSEEDR